jgi:hypothetical protein
MPDLFSIDENKVRRLGTNLFFNEACNGPSAYTIIKDSSVCVFNTLVSVLGPYQLLGHA